MIEGGRERVYRATPGCVEGCPRCNISCAVATLIRDDIMKDLARAEAAVLEFRPQAKTTRH